jgi:hypothetical protein
MMANANPHKGVRTERTPSKRGLNSIDPLPLMPSILDLGRQVVRLANKREEADCAILDLKNQALAPKDELSREREFKGIMDRSFDRECLLVDVALGMRARTLGDVAVLLGLIWRVVDLEAGSEFEEHERTAALAKIRHAALTSLDVVIRETGLDLAETVGGGTQDFIDREHVDLGDGL